VGESGRETATGGGAGEKESNEGGSSERKREYNKLSRVREYNVLVYALAAPHTFFSLRVCQEYTLLLIANEYARCQRYTESAGAHPLPSDSFSLSCVLGFSLFFPLFTRTHRLNKRRSLHLSLSLSLSPSLPPAGCLHSSFESEGFPSFFFFFSEPKYFYEDA
jgi:hypothetical protein